MPNQTQHLSHAKSNLEFFNSFFDKHNKNDWSITVAFYTAVHLVEYVISKDKNFTIKGKKINIEHSDQLQERAQLAGIECPLGINKESLSPHQARNYLLTSCDEFKDLHEFYISLFKKSKVARYKQFIWEDFQVDLLIGGLFNPILDWLNKNHGTTFTKISIKTKL